MRGYAAFAPLAGFRPPPPPLPAQALAQPASPSRRNLLPDRSAAHHGLTPVKLAPGLQKAAEDWPTSELFLVSHRALREVPRVRVVWELLVERLGTEKRRR